MERRVRNRLEIQFIVDPLPSFCIPDKCTENQAEILVCRAAHLLAEIGLHSRPSHVPTANELESIRPQFNEIMTEYFVGVMVCGKSDNPVIEMLAGHVLAASLAEFDQEKLHPSTAIRACRMVRQMQDGKHPHLGAVLRNLPRSNSTDVLNFLNQIHDRTVTESITPLVIIMQLLRRYVTGRRVRRDDQPNPKRRTEDLSPIAETDLGSAKTNYYSDRNSDGDIDSACLHLDVELSVPPSQQQSLRLQMHNAKAMTSQIIRSFMMSPIRWGVLTEETLRQLVLKLRSGVMDRNPVDALLVIALLTGRSVNTVNHIKIQKVNVSERRRYLGTRLIHTDTYLALQTGLELPAPSRDKQFQNYYVDANPILNIALPNEILTCILGRKCPYVTPSEISDRIRSLRANLRQVTAARIASAAYLWLYHRGWERTLLDRLFGREPEHATPLFYENMREENVLKAYDDWFSYINGLIPSHTFTRPRLKSDTRIGSRRTPRLEHLQQSFSDYREYVIQLLKHENLIAAHNHYAIYTYHVLSFATGLRPILEPFGNFGEFCHETGMYYIRDKDVRGGPSPRFVPLACVALTQLKYYRKYLKELSPYLEAMPNRYNDYMNRIFDSQAPFLFTINEVDSSINALAPRTIRKFVKNFFPRDLNWSRHFLRTQLRDYGVRDDVIQAFMGHGSVGHEPYSRYSALTVGHLFEAATVIDKLAGRIGIKPLSHRPNAS